MKSRVPQRIELGPTFRGHPMRTVLLGFFAGAAGIFALLAAMNARGITMPVLFWAIVACSCAAPLVVMPEGQKLEHFLVRWWLGSRRPKRLVKYGRPAADQTVSPVVEAPPSSPTAVPRVSAPTPIVAQQPFRILRPLALGVALVSLPISLLCSNQPFAREAAEFVATFHLSVAAVS